MYKRLNLWYYSIGVMMMPKAIVISEEEYAEIVKLRKANKDKNIERRLYVLVLRYQGMSYNEIAKVTGYNSQYAQLLVCTYRKQGLSEYARKKQTGHCWNMSYEDEQRILDECAAEAAEGKILSAQNVRQKLEAFLGRKASSNYAYDVMKRHGWRKVMPRSKHPKAASQEAQDGSKKLTRNTRDFVYSIQT